MQTIFIKIGNNKCEITDPKLWEQVKGNEKEYFRILRERQIKKACDDKPGK